MSNKNEAYLCLSAMLRAREPRLLNDDRAQRMLEAPSFEAVSYTHLDVYKRQAKPSEAGSIWKRKKEAEEGSFREQRKRNVSASF